MAEEKFYRIKEVCEMYKLRHSFLEEVLRHELIIVRHEDPEPLVGDNQIPEIRRIRRLYEGLDINYEGIEMILEMRSRLINLMEENNELRRKVRELEERKENELENYLRQKGWISDVD